MNVCISNEPRVARKADVWGKEQGEADKQGSGSSIYLRLNARLYEYIVVEEAHKQRTARVTNQLRWGTGTYSDRKNEGKTKPQ